MLWEIQYTLRDNLSTAYLAQTDCEILIPCLEETRSLIKNMIAEISKLDQTLSELLNEYTDECHP